MSQTIKWPQYRRWPANISVPLAGNDKDKNVANAEVVKEIITAPTVLQVISPTLLHLLTVLLIRLLTEPKGKINFIEMIKAYNPGKETSEHHTLFTFRKLYGNKLQYDRKKSTDSFDHKFLLWINHCHMARIPADILFIIFSKMLKNAAMDYFYTNVYKNQMSIISMCYIIKLHFETNIYRGNI